MPTAASFYDLTEQQPKAQKRAGQTFKAVIFTFHNSDAIFGVPKWLADIFNI